MTTDFLAAILRTLLQMLGAAALAYGVGTEDQWAAIIGGATAFAAIGHMILARWNTRKVPAK